jgi:hypothetical protein
MTHSSAMEDILEEFENIKILRATVIFVASSTDHGIVIKECEQGIYEIVIVDNGRSKVYENKSFDTAKKSVNTFLTTYNSSIKHIWEKNK